MKLKFATQISLIFIAMIFSEITHAQMQIGMFADCQYCNCEPHGSRFYRNSLFKLKKCISTFNKNKNIEFVVGLGDLIDHNFSSFDSVQQVLNTSKNRIFNVPGNHDFSVEQSFIDKVPEKLHLPKTYHTFSKKGWQFIFLNGNEITLQSNNPEIVSQAKQFIKKLTFAHQPNNKEWNGGMSETQINWLEKQLQKAQKRHRKVVLFCHYPLLPTGVHNLWNAEKVLNLLQNYSCVKAWFNGHNHAGNYAFQNGIHFINLKGMIETKSENAFCVVTLSKDKIQINGFGREKDKTLKIK
ncbi:MAG: metallophosphoesterase [Prolixibacteraceae bacterium]|nr:metallophosphoesterase [Prolixibacteraceae bacterium]